MSHYTIFLLTQVDISLLEKFVMIVSFSADTCQVCELVDALSNSEDSYKQMVEILHCLSTHYYSMTVTKSLPISKR